MLQIPTAKEARKQVEEMQTEFGNHISREIVSTIQDAINFLQTSCYIDGSIPEVSKKFLETKGYKVEELILRNELCTKISW